MNQQVKVKDMNKEYILIFFAEYSHYIKELEKTRKEVGLEHIRLLCPSEFFKDYFLQILKDTEMYEYAFKTKQ